MGISLIDSTSSKSKGAQVGAFFWPPLTGLVIT